MNKTQTTMRQFLFFTAICFLSTCTMLGALGSKHPLPLVAVAWGLSFFYAFCQRARIRRKQARRRQAYLHEQCMRTYLRNNGIRY
jgi:hypothetical protein